nr:MAG: hypothetical protein [Caudoviricetes sp.]
MKWYSVSFLVQVDDSVDNVEDIVFEVVQHKLDESPELGNVIDFVCEEVN